jgi:hypothetical protein
MRGLRIASDAPLVQLLKRDSGGKPCLHQQQRSTHARVSELGHHSEAVQHSRAFLLIRFDTPAANKDTKQSRTSSTFRHDNLKHGDRSGTTGVRSGCVGKLHHLTSMVVSPPSLPSAEQP